MRVGNMRIIAVYRYFWPDNAPYGRILKNLLTNFAKNHECSVLSGFPSYNYKKNKKVVPKEIVDGITVQRVKTDLFLFKILDFLFFFIYSFFYLLKNRNKYDVLIVNSFPPVFMGFFARIVSFFTGIKYVYHIQDIHPECLKFSKKIKNEFLFKFFKNIDKKNIDRSDMCVTLSDDMKNELICRGCLPKKIMIINNPSQSKLSILNDEILPAEFPLNKFVILFAGNMGKFQELDLFIQAAIKLRSNDDIVFVFMGDGAAKHDLLFQAGGCVGKNVIFIPYQEPEVAGLAMQSAKLGIVSLKPGLTKVAYPSKIPTLLCHGCPILALVEKKSEIAHVISENKLGFVLPNRDSSNIALSIDNIWKNWEDFDKNRFSSNVNRIFGEKTIMKNWEDLFEHISSKL